MDDLYDLFFFLICQVLAARATLCADLRLLVATLLFVIFYTFS